jgi:hypothetical protein
VSGNEPRNGGEREREGRWDDDGVASWCVSTLSRLQFVK